MAKVEGSIQSWAEEMNIRMVELRDVMEDPLGEMNDSPPLARLT